MPAFDLISLSILWCIGLLAMLQAINARGAIRVALSGIVTVVIFVMAGFFTYLKIEGYGSFVSEELSPRSLVAINEAISGRNVEVSGNGEPEAVSKESPKNREVGTAYRRYTTAAQKIANDGIALAEQIEQSGTLAHGTSEPVREIAESKALAIRNSTARVNSRATSLFHPKSLSEIHGELVRASEFLRLAGYALHAYTTIEDAEERKAQFEQSKRQAALAVKAFTAYLSSIEKLP